MDGSQSPDAPSGEVMASPELNVGQVANTVMVNGDQVFNLGGRLQWTKEASVDDLVEAERKLDLAVQLWSFRALLPSLVTAVAALATSACSWWLANLAEPEAYANAPKWFFAVGIALTSAIYAAIFWGAASESRRRYVLLDACAARQWAEVRVELAMRGHFRKSDQRVIALMKRKHLAARLGGLIGSLLGRRSDSAESERT